MVASSGTYPFAPFSTPDSSSYSIFIHQCFNNRSKKCDVIDNLSKHAWLYIHSLSVCVFVCAHACTKPLGQHAY